MSECKNLISELSFQSVGKNTKARDVRIHFSSSPQTIRSCFNGSILLLLISLRSSLSSFFNRCMNLHARISSLIANPVFPLFLCPSRFPSLPHLWWCTLTALSGTWDVYRWTVRVAAQMSVCVCVCVCGGVRFGWGLLLEWPHCHRDERPFPAYCVSVCFVYLYQSVPRVCIHVSLRGGRIQPEADLRVSLSLTQNCNM